MFLTLFFDCSLKTRESALASADLEEKLHQEQGQERRKSQSRGKAAGGETLGVNLSHDGDQRRKIPLNPEEERLKNERTVFVGNLPVTCNKKVSGRGSLKLGELSAEVTFVELIIDNSLS